LKSHPASSTRMGAGWLACEHFFSPRASHARLRDQRQFKLCGRPAVKGNVFVRSRSDVCCTVVVACATSRMRTIGRDEPGQPKRFRLPHSAPDDRRRDPAACLFIAHVPEPTVAGATRAGNGLVMFVSECSRRAFSLKRPLQFRWNFNQQSGPPRLTPAVARNAGAGRTGRRQGVG
jgi:hypothetical protein